jgi:poly(3-hydroxybutyrate) depolymerase
MQKCWNWFSAADQQRDVGEPSLIAGITREVMRDYAIDRRRVYIAGFSAGGAAAAIMGDAYPDLYAAIGVHSGLACGAARDTPPAFAAMRGNGGLVPRHPRSGSVASRVVPAIVFHGDKDTTVDPRNADSVVAQSGQGAVLGRRVETGQVAGGLAYSRMLHADASGETVIEQWVRSGSGRPDGEGWLLLKQDGLHPDCHTKPARSPRRRGPAIGRPAGPRAWAQTLAAVRCAFAAFS